MRRFTAFATIQRNTAVINTLIKAAADIDARDIATNESVLHTAATIGLFCDTKICRTDRLCKCDANAALRLLVEARAECDTVANSGWTPLVAATSRYLSD